MNKFFSKKGFTLIELLAVIVVLAIILVIAVPRVLNVIDESNKESFRINGENLIKAAKDRQVYNTVGPFEKKTYIIEDGEFVGDSIPMSGKLPNSATIVSNADGTISMVAKSGNYCIKKSSQEEKATFVNEEDCSLPVSSKIYGVTFNNATIGTRTDDAVEMTYTVNESTIDSSFDTAEIYKDITEETDIYGNVFVKIPSFYIKKTKSAGNVWTYQISKEKVNNDYYLPECFKNQTTDELLDYVFIGKYLATFNETKMESKAGAAPQVFKNIATFRSYAMANGAGYQLLDIHAVDLLQVLFFVEFATPDSQSIMTGISQSWNSPVNGVTDSVTTASGSPLNNTNGKNPMKYRGIESLYGREWQLVDGINIKNHTAYVSKNSNNYNSTVFTGEYTPIGYLTSLSEFENYIIELGYDSNYPYANFPISTGVEANSIYKDFFARGKMEANYTSIAMYGGSYGWNNHAGINSWDFGDYSNGYAASCCSTATTRLMKKDI